MGSVFKPPTTAGDTRGLPLTKDELLALIPPGSSVYYCNTARRICVVQTPESEVLAILNGSEGVAVAQRARLIACIPLLLDAVAPGVIDRVGQLVQQEPAEGDPRRAWPPTQWGL